MGLEDKRLSKVSKSKVKICRKTPLASTEETITTESLSLRISARRIMQESDKKYGLIEFIEKASLKSGSILRSTFTSRMFPLMFPRNRRLKKFLRNHLVIPELKLVRKRNLLKPLKKLELEPQGLLRTCEKCGERKTFS